jgi:hypothetical protein
VAKRQLALEDAELKMKEKEIALKNIELDRKLAKERKHSDSFIALYDSGTDDEEDKAEEENGQKCSWPECMFGNLPTEICQSCNNNHLHHVCQTEWEHSRGLDNEQLHKLCFPCAERFRHPSEQNQQMPI